MSGVLSCLLCKLHYVRSKGTNCLQTPWGYASCKNLNEKREQTIHLACVCLVQSEMFSIFMGNYVLTCIHFSNMVV